MLASRRPPDELPLMLPPDEPPPSQLLPVFPQQSRHTQEQVGLQMVNEPAATCSAEQRPSPVEPGLHATAIRASMKATARMATRSLATHRAGGHAAAVTVARSCGSATVV